MNRLAVAVAAGVVFGGCTAEDVGTGTESTEAALTQGDDTLANTLQAGVDAVHQAGVVGAIARVYDGSQLRAQARAGESQLNSGTPVEYDGYFRMGSDTKTFVAVVMLQLVGEGRASLDDAVERWLPGVVAGNGNDGRTVTIRQLLQHTSGIFNYTAEVFNPFTVDDYYETRSKHTTPESLVAVAMGHPPDFAPGSAWSYSNTNYILLGMIIEKITDNSWSDEVESRILSPLGLESTLDPNDWPDLPAPHATGYELFSTDTPLVDVTLFNVSWAGAAGALITTADDLAHFWRALQAGELLGPAEMDAMHTTVPAPKLATVIPGARYGLGIFQADTSCGATYWAHFGDTPGYSTRNAVSEDGERVVITLDNTTLDTDGALPVIKGDVQILNDAICGMK
jgi:D-alanyl-D-alanine carboxypeptidase